MDVPIIRDGTSNNTAVDEQESTPLLQTTDRTSPLNADDGDSPIAFPAAEGYASISPATSSFARGHRASTITSIVSTSYQIVKEHFNKRKFLAVVFASLFTYLTFVGLFAPRTSLSRDFRRWHRSRFTSAEVYRRYLDAVQNTDLSREHIRRYCEEYAALQDNEEENDNNRLNYVTHEFEKLGFTPKLEKYYPWVSTPIDTGVELVKNGTTAWEASMVEDSSIIGEDGEKHGSVFGKGFHSYSPSGEVTAQFVYCNYGTLDDYGRLVDNNIDIEGKIHIIRYGKLLPYIKIKNAELYGASSVILYTDPGDDGFVTVKNGFKPFPEGPARNPSSIERCSVEFLTESPGDPTSPDFPSKYLDEERFLPAGRIPRIPSVPLSARDATILLNQLNFRGLQFESPGNIPGFSYHSGPSSQETRIKLLNKQDTGVVEISNVVVDIPGLFPDGTIIIGASRDSLTPQSTTGAISGSAILLEVARGMSKLQRLGWKPLKPIRFISWGGEAPGMLGSTDYVEDHQNSLKRKALAYIDLGIPVSGSKFECKANQLLYSVLHRAAKSTELDWDDNWTLLDYWRSVNGGDVGILGGTSAYSPFQNHLGIPSVACAFENDGRNDPVHQRNSIYDSLEWIEKHVDPDFRLHKTLATFTGMVGLILAENEVHSFEVHRYFKKLLENFVGINDLIKLTFPHDRKLSQMGDVLLKTIITTTDHDSIEFDHRTKLLQKECLQELPLWSVYKKLKLYLRVLLTNRRLRLLDQQFVLERGLKDRKWMKYSLSAPDKFKGCVGDVFPGLHEALVESDREEVFQWLETLQLQFDNIREWIR